jgi:hypothetical protein
MPQCTLAQQNKKRKKERKRKFQMETKITRAKWAGVVAQAVENLLCKHEALSSMSGFRHTHTHTH